MASRSLYPVWDDVYGSGSFRRVTGIWTKSPGAGWMRRSLSEPLFRSEIEVAHRKGMRVVRLSREDDRGQRRFLAVGDGGRSQYRYGLTPKEFEDGIRAISPPYHPIWIDASWDGDERRYAIVVAYDGRGVTHRWEVSYGLFGIEFERMLAAKREAGYWPSVVNVR